MFISYARNWLIIFIDHILFFLFFTSVIEHDEHILGTDQIPENALRDQQNSILKTRTLMFRIIKILRVLIYSHKFIRTDGHKHTETRQQNEHRVYTLLDVTIILHLVDGQPG